MKDRKEKFRAPILAAGGIVLRNGRDLERQFAVVQSRKLATWGLPKGKLAAGEDAVTAAHREVLEETGHHVTVHEFLGTLVYETNSRPKVVQFWRMEAAGAPAGKLMRDVMAIDWLGLTDAINRLSHMRERLFLEQVGPVALKLIEQQAGALFRGPDADRILVPGVLLAPANDTSFFDEAVECAERARPRPFGHDFAAMAATHPIEPLAPRKSPPDMNGAGLGLSKLGLGLMKKTWGWLRCGAVLRRHPLD